MQLDDASKILLFRIFQFKMRISDPGFIYAQLTYNDNMPARLRLNYRMLPILVVVLIILQVIDPAIAWKTLLVFLGGAWLLGWVWAYGLAKGLKFTREMRYGWAQVGDELEERFTIYNDSMFPATWLEITDYSNLPDYHASFATLVGGKSTSELTTHGRCARRGLYTLGATSLQSGDPLGIYSIQINDPGRQTLLVLPPVIPLPPISVTPGGFWGDGRPRNQTPEQSVGAAGVREYQPGDALRMIHWPTSAKHDKTFVRLLEGTPAADWWIVLDLDGAVQIGAGWDSSEEHAVILAASLVDRGLRSRIAVGLAVNGEQPSWQTPSSNPDQRWGLLRSLALARTGTLNLQQFLERSAGSFGRQSSLVIITSNIEPAWSGSLAELQWRGSVVPTIMLLEPASFGGTASAFGLASQLQHMGLACHIITRDLLNRPEAHPGQAGRWEWHISATGKAIPIHKPAESGWRKLA